MWTPRPLSLGSSMLRMKHLTPSSSNLTLLTEQGFECQIIGRKHRNKNDGKSSRVLLDLALSLGIKRRRKHATIKLNPGKQTLELRIDLGRLRWYRTSRIIVPFMEIAEVQEGKHSRNFQRYGKDLQENFCFSIILKKNTRLMFASIDVVCIDQSARDKVAGTIRVAVLRAQWFADPLSGISQLSKQRDAFWASQFRKFDLNGDGVLSLEELEHMLVHMGFPETAAETSYEKVDEHGNLQLTENDFIQFCHKVRTVEHLRPLFDKYIEKQNEVQALNGTPEGIKDQSPLRLVTEIQSSLQMKGLSLFLADQGEGDDTEPHAWAILERYGMGVDCLALDFVGFCDYILSAKMNTAVQTMCIPEDLPLADYLISSSHNTYLLADQLSGSCGIVAYINAFRQGFRCIEVDTHDGKRGPIITHGNTLTERLSFEDFVKVTKEYAFRDTLHPVIISLENHCSRPKQAAMADCMRRVWGDENIYRWAFGTSSDVTMPSLRDLRGKYIIKAKVVPGDTHPELAELVFLRSTSAKSETLLSSPANMMISLEEEAAKLDDRVIAPACRQFAKTHLVRMYPKGRRVYSSNFNPIHAWCRGYQMAALNCQTHCQKYRINQILFQETGGYLPFQSVGIGGENEKTIKEIKVLMGYLLPRSKVKKKLPLLKVSVFLYDVLSQRVRLESFWNSSDDVDDDNEDEDVDVTARLARFRTKFQNRAIEDDRKDNNIATRRLLQEDSQEESTTTRARGSFSSSSRRSRRTNGSETMSQRKSKLHPDFETDAVLGNSFNPVFTRNAFLVPPYPKSTLIMFVVTDASTNNKVRAFGGAMLSRLRSGIRPLRLLDPSGIPFENGTCLLLDIRK